MTYGTQSIKQRLARSIVIMHEAQYAGDDLNGTHCLTADKIENK